MAVRKDRETRSRQRRNNKRKRRRAKQETHSYNRTPPEAFLPRMKENEKRPSSNTRMKKTDETNDKLSKQIQED